MIQHLIILIPQLVMYFFANPFSTKEEVAFTWPFRNVTFHSDINQDLYLKKKQLDIAHRSGGQGVFTVCLGFALVCGLYQPSFWIGVLTAFVVGANCALIYGYRFDTGYATQIGKKWWYLGEYAGTDKWWLKKFGPQGGKLKVWISYFFMVLFNILYFIFYKRIV